MMNIGLISWLSNVMHISAVSQYLSKIYTSFSNFLFDYRKRHREAICIISVVVTAANVAVLPLVDCFGHSPQHKNCVPNNLFSLFFFFFFFDYRQDYQRNKSQMISRYCLLILTNVSIIGLQNITEINQTSLGFRQTTISSLHEVFLFIKSTASWFLKLFFLNEVDLKSDCTNKQMTTHKIYN